MDKKQTIETILNQINADHIIAQHFNGKMYDQPFTADQIGWFVRSTVTWQVIDTYPGQPNITAVFFDVLLMAKPDQEGAFQFPGTEDWVRNLHGEFAIADQEFFGMKDLYQLIYDRVCAVGKEMANWRPGLVKFNFDDKMLWWEYKPPTEVTDNLLEFMGQPGFNDKNPEDTSRGTTKEEPKKINFREFL